jgi:hypothetical protein
MLALLPRKPCSHQCRLPARPAASNAGNVLYESYDASTVRLLSANNTLLDNLALGAAKEAQGKSSFDQQLPASFEVGPAVAGCLPAVTCVLPAASTCLRCAVTLPVTLLPAPHACLR